MKNYTEKGFALVLAIVLLLAMSLMGGSLIMISSGDHDSNNTGDQYQQTFYIAEMALLEGERMLLDEKTGPWQNKTQARDYSKRHLPEPSTTKFAGETYSKTHNNYKPGDKYKFTTFKRQKTGANSFKNITKDIDKYFIDTSSICFNSFPEIDHDNFFVVLDSEGDEAARSYNFGKILNDALKTKTGITAEEEAEISRLKEFYYEYFIERIGSASIRGFGSSIKAGASDVSKNGVAYRVYGCGIYGGKEGIPGFQTDVVKMVVPLESTIILPK
tara:strand:- start:147 stop:965 length:819 start_codon:yes stop_codon:yes gene_type:complete